MKPKTRNFIIFLIGILVFSSIPVYGEANKVIDEEVKKQAEKVLSKEDLLNPKIPMNLKHQNYLYHLCQTKDLDYMKTLAVIRLESKFNPNTVSSNTYGYMQIHKMHHDSLAKEHGTLVAPLDPYANLNWGTTMLSNLYRTFEREGLSGSSLDRAVLSAFNKGEYGYRRTGEATKFIEIYRSNLDWIKNQY